MSQTLPLLLGLLVSSGCYPRLTIDVGGVGDGGATDGGGPDGGSPDGGADGGDSGPGVLDVVSVTPENVPTSGGVDAEILGGPFDESAQVLFADRGAELIGVEKYRLQVIVPPSAGSATGPVDVTVSTDSAVGVLEHGVLYWPDVNGKAQVLGAWLQLDPVGATTAPTSFDTWLRLIEASDDTPMDRYGVELDACGTPVNGVGSVVGPKDLRLGYAGDPLELTWSKERLEYTIAITEPPPMTEDADLDFEAPASGFSPDLAITGAGHTPTTLRLTNPDLGVGVPTLSSSNAVLDWTPGGYDYVLISAGVGDSTLFICPVRDTGEFQLNRSLFDGLEYSSIDGVDGAEIWLGAVGVVRTESDLVHSNGQVRIDVGFGEVGTIVIQRSFAATDQGDR